MTLLLSGKIQDSFPTNHLSLVALQSIWWELEHVDLDDFFPTMHNVYIRDYDSPVYKIALYLLQGNNRISMYIRRILAIPLVKSVVDTGEYLRENHEFRV